MSLIDPEGYWTGFSARIRVIAYNTKTRDSPSDAPQSIFDFADPKWKGQVAIADPRFGSTSFHVAPCMPSPATRRWTTSSGG